MVGGRCLRGYVKVSIARVSLGSIFFEYGGTPSSRPLLCEDPTACGFREEFSGGSAPWLVGFVDITALDRVVEVGFIECPGVFPKLFLVIRVESLERDEVKFLGVTSLLPV